MQSGLPPVPDMPSAPAPPSHAMTDGKKAKGLQHTALPRREGVLVDPDRPLDAALYRRANMNSAPGALPSETYQYDLVYEAFRNDKEFWNHWKVIGCVRNSPDMSMSQERATIRVVLDLPQWQKLYPTAYTPGFSTLPMGAERSDSSTLRCAIPGLPPGYSVALEVHILEDTKMLLAHQRSFRNGEIDPKYEWLDEIVKQAERAGQRTNPRAKAKVGRSAAAKSADRPGSDLRPPAGELPLDCGERNGEYGLSDALTPYSDLYGESAKVAKHVNIGKSQVYAENTFVSAFGDGAGLPRHDTDLWGRAPKAVEVDSLQRQREQDQALEEKLARLTR